VPKFPQVHWSLQTRVWMPQEPQVSLSVLVGLHSKTSSTWLLQLSSAPLQISAGGAGQVWTQVGPSLQLL
jgi:hypothetical protein